MLPSTGEAGYIQHGVQQNVFIIIIIIIIKLL